MSYYYLIPVVCIFFIYLFYFSQKNAVLRKIMFVLVGLVVLGLGYVIFSYFYGGNRLENVCVGIPYESAQAYDPNAKGVHPVVLFTKELEGSFKSIDLVTSHIETREWGAPFWSPSKTELVACTVLTPLKKGETCDYFSRGGNAKLSESDTYSAKFEMVLYEAKTGKKLNQTSFTLPAPSCPSVKRTRKNDRVYPFYMEQFVKLAKSFVEKK